VTTSTDNFGTVMILIVTIYPCCQPLINTNLCPDNLIISGILARKLLLAPTGYGARCYACHCGESIAPDSLKATRVTRPLRALLDPVIGWNEESNSRCEGSSRFHSLLLSRRLFALKITSTLPFALCSSTLS
jgi:hypothetical protein